MEKVNIKNPKFAYFIGYFIADGCFYSDRSGYRFEFSDGSSVKEELFHSYDFLMDIKRIIKDILNIETPNLRKRGNKYVLSFRSIKLKEIFIKKFNFKPGAKTFIVDIPSFYRNTNLEKFFWLGVMDGDGMVARNSRKVSLEVGSRNLINSFEDFLEKNNIKYKKRKRELNNNIMRRIDIGSSSFRDYCDKTGFIHSRKKKWVIKHLKKDFYIKNKVNFSNLKLSNNMIDYAKIFDKDNIFIVNGTKFFNKKIKNRNNVKFRDILNFLQSKKINKYKIYRMLSKFKWKMSKGSKNTVKIPLYFNKDIEEIAKIIRLSEGGIRVSKRYIQSLNKDPNEMISNIQSMFYIKPKYTFKKEPIFCSGVLTQLFSKIINRREQIHYTLPKWYSKLK